MYFSKHVIEENISLNLRLSKIDETKTSFMEEMKENLYRFRLH